MLERDSTAFICHECLEVFLFEDDLKRHEFETAHRGIQVINLKGLTEVGD